MQEKIASKPFQMLLSVVSWKKDLQVRRIGHGKCHFGKDRDHRQ